MDNNKNLTSLANKESQKTSVSISPMVHNVLSYSTIPYSGPLGQEIRELKKSTTKRIRKCDAISFSIVKNLILLEKYVGWLGQSLHHNVQKIKLNTLSSNRNEID